MQTILVLTDFSDTAFHAAEYACFLAKYYNTQQLILLNSYFIHPTALANQPVVAMSVPDLQAESEKLLQDWQTKLSVITNDTTTIRSISTNLPINEVLDEISKSEEVRLTVMGMKGKSNLEKVLVGSTAIRTMGQINLPLMLIPVDAPITIPKKIVLAIDLSTFKEAGKNHLIRVLDLLQGQILVINLARNEKYSTELREEIQLMHDLLDKYNVEYHYDSDKNVATAINTFAHQHQADLIITIHRKNNSILSFFQKSITQRLAWNTTVPLLVLPL